MLPASPATGAHTCRGKIDDSLILLQWTHHVLQDVVNKTLPHSCSGRGIGSAEKAASQSSNQDVEQASQRAWDTQQQLRSDNDQ